MAPRPLKPVVWVGPTLDELRACPGAVQDEVGYALYLAQEGVQQHPAAKPLKGELGGLIEIVAGDRSGTYRAVYTAKLEHAIYVLHVFQKKSTRGIATPKHVVNLLKARWRDAQQQDRAASED